MTGDRVSVGIVNYNGEVYLAGTLQAVGRLGPPVDDILVIDNGSSDRSVALVRAQFPQVQVLELGGNRGPGAGRNEALRNARHDRVLLLDNDVEPQSGCVEALSAALDAHPSAVLSMAAICYATTPDIVQHLGAEPHFLGTPAVLDAEVPVARLADPVRVVRTVISSCLLVDRARFGARPWFDERLFIYLEDHEFGLRVTLQGFDCLIVPGARCLHGAGTPGVSIRESGRFTPTRVRYTIRNRWLTLLMLYQTSTLLRFAPALAAFEVLQLVGATAKGWLPHWLWALGSTARALPHVLRKRRAMRPQRRRADLDVLVGGPFPYNKAMHRSALERAAQRSLDAIAGLNWKLAGGSRTR